MYNPLKTRKGRLEFKIGEELSKDKPNLDKIISSIEDYQLDNLKTIYRLKRNKKIEINKINGSLKQTIDAHGPITKELIGSCSKRIYGSLLSTKKRDKFRKISIRDVLIGIIISAIVFIILFA